MQGDESLTIRQMCETAAVSRAGYYRSWRKKEPRIEETALRDAIQKEALSRRHRGGYRPITRALKNNGWMINHKRVLRLMREDNLLSIRRRRFVVTTDSDHGWRVYPNLASRMVVSDINQLWVADITYVRLQQEFIYLAVILDVYSRRAVGWDLSRRLERQVAQQALEMALRERRPLPGLVHHSDRGVQYASGDYVKRLESCGITISMSRPGNPWDNAWAERFIKTLKVEEINGQRYRNFDHAKTCIGTFIEEVYNQQRMHSALDYLSPIEFENDLQNKRREVVAKTAGVSIAPIADRGL